MSDIEIVSLSGETNAALRLTANNVAIKLLEVIATDRREDDDRPLLWLGIWDHEPADTDEPLIAMVPIVGRLGWYGWESAPSPFVVEATTTGAVWVAISSTGDVYTTVTTVDADCNLSARFIRVP